ncbi:MAG: flavodoxin family protein [Treponema sp.]|jgi:putative NADPH-quinone reductase/putative sterol carrier protein|nr:flavodoxin family protein [Treponema sp.]
MNILVLNGSPRPAVSNTMKLTTAFLEGMGGHSIETVNISEEGIEPCRGCFCCWEKTPGKCVIADDMETLLRKYREAELVIWSFPLYCFGLPSEIKAFMDRLLPLTLPFINEMADGKPVHPARYDLEAQRHVLISTCGFFTVEKNYDALVKQFDIFFGGRYTKILCPQGELFRVPQLRSRTDEYLELVRLAGAEYFSTGAFSPETEKQLAVPLYPKEAFIAMANASWEIAETTGVSETSGQINPRERLLRQMAAVYTPLPNAPKEEKRVEFFFTDSGEAYQLIAGETGAVFVKDSSGFAPYSVRIETPFSVWQDISEGRITGTEALFLGKYRVLGDFSLMTTVMSGFSPGKAQAPTQEAGKKRTTKKRSMLVLLMPFMALWILLPVFGNAGALAAILTAACVPLATRFFRLSPYDNAAAFLVVVLGAAFLAGAPLSIIVTLSYLLFGGMWLVSLFLKIPLCAWYSANGYGGDEAFGNPLFIRTNKIIAGMWGVLYLFVSVWTWFFMKSDYASFVGLVNSIAPALAGLFTAAFVKWYPARYARKAR